MGVRIFIGWLLVLGMAQYTQAQELVVIKKVEQDSVSIKWLPSDFDQLKKIATGATVYRAESSATQNFESVNFNSAKIWKISPTKERYDAIHQTTKLGEKTAVLLDPIFNPSNDVEQENFAFGTALIENIIHPEFQFVLGNILVDKEIEESKSYVYKIEVKGLPAAYISVNTNDITRYSSIDDISLSLDRKKTVGIEWSALRYQQEAFGFEIEHAVDHIKEGTFITDLPYLPFQSEFEKKDKNALYRHSPEAGHFHYYRIHGKDLFGHRSLISEWEKIYVPLLINAWCEIDTIYANAQKREVFGVVHPLQKNTNISTLSLMRSLERDGDYSLVESKQYNDSVYVFSIPEKKTGDHYYYQLAAIGKDDTVASVPYYFFTLDQEPPSPPSELKGSVNSKGLATITWSASVDDDVLGYKVFRANSKKEEFVERTIKLDKSLSFIDTLALNNLTPEVYYYIQAVDLNYNQSSCTDTLLVLKPDTISPIACIIKDVEMKDSVLQINWINSDSRDVWDNYLLRFNETITDTVFSWSNKTDHFVDTSLVEGQHYKYQIVSLDLSENRTESNKVYYYFEPGYRKAIKNFNGMVNQERNEVSLSWEKPYGQVYSYKIYRGKSSEKLKHLKTITNPEQTYFRDSNLKINNQYVYTIKYINDLGIHSIPARIEVVY